MLHKKQIIHKIYDEMTDRRETRIIYCQLNVLSSRMLVSIHTNVYFHPSFSAKSGLEGIFYWFEKEKKGEKGSKNCLQSFTSFKGFQGGFLFMFALQHGADSSGKEFSFASWSISAEHKQGLFNN